MAITLTGTTHFRKYYMRYYAILVVYATRIIAAAGMTATEAEDIVQEAFCGMWEHPLAFENETALRSYLYTTVRNMCLDERKHRRVVKQYEAFAAAGSPPLAGIEPEEMEREEMLKRILDMIDAMPRRQREVFLLLIEGKRAKEIAAMMNISINTVKMQKRRGIIAIRENLGQQGLCLVLMLVGF